MGTVRADDPRLTARGVEADTQPRRLGFGRGPLPDGSELELRSAHSRSRFNRMLVAASLSLLTACATLIVSVVATGKPEFIAKAFFPTPVSPPTREEERVIRSIAIKQDE